MINYDYWVADISSRYSVAIYPKDSGSVGCVLLKEGLEYAKKRKNYDSKSELPKKSCHSLFKKTCNTVFKSIHKSLLITLIPCNSLFNIVENLESIYYIEESCLTIFRCNSIFKRM